jgi:autotransporter translocation and assembly factor TamB
LITVLAPVAILAVWGSSYVWSCVTVLSAPGKPVEYKYRSRSGELRFWAESYAIDLKTGTGHATHPRIFGPDGQVIGSAERIDVSGISFSSLNAVSVAVRDVKAKLKRLKSGRFDIQDYLPEKQGPPSDVSYLVTVNRVDLALTDLAGKTPYLQEAIATDVEVRGVGDKWFATGALELPGTGKLSAEVQNLPNEGFLLRGNTSGLRLAGLLDHVRETPDIERAAFLKDFHAASLEAIGPVSLYIPKDKSFQVETRIKAIGQNVRYQDYSADQAYFNGTVSENQATGELDARLGPTKAMFNGSLVWRGDLALGGRLVVDSPTPGSLPHWAHKILPSQVAYNNAHLDGWIDYRKGPGVRLEASIAAPKASFYEQAFDQPKISLTAGTDQIRVGIDGGKWAGTPVHGAVLVGLKSPGLTGAITADAVNLATVADRFKAHGLNGKATVSLLLGGTPAKPTAILEASGSGSYRINGQLVTGRFQAAGNYVADQVNIDRLRVHTDAGNARAVGVVSLRKRTLSLQVDATNIRIEKLRKDLIGSINASGVVNGTLSDPQFSGSALALGIKVSDQEIPFISGSLKANKDRMIANDLRIIKGTGEATGDAALNFHTRGLSGTLSANNVLLNEYLGDQALGSVTVPKLTLGGTLDQPRFAGTAYGDNLLLGGIRVDRAEIASSMNGSVVNVESLTAKVGDGTIAASGKYDYSQKFGTFTGKGENLALARITPPGKGQANVTGVLNGDAQATISPSGTWRGKANGVLKNVNLNDTEFGNGTWNIGYDGEDVTGNAAIGKLDRFLLLEDVDYNTNLETIRAQVSVMNGSIQDLYTSSRPFFSELSYEARRRLDTAAGDIDSTVLFTGGIRDPDIDVKFLDAHNLVLQDTKLGSVKAAFNKAGTLWSIDSLKWTGWPDATGTQSILLLNKGTIDTAGAIHLDGELSDFDLQYVGLIDKSWDQLRGRASVSFLATGMSQSPDIRASLESTRGSAFTVGATGESFRVNLDTIHISQALYATDGTYTGGISATGKFYYRGLAGDVEAHIPMNYPLEIPDGPQIVASLSFPNVDLKEVARYASAIDIAKSSGSLQGLISIVGPKANLALRGSLSGKADTIAFNDIQTTLKATVVDVKLQDNQIVMSFGTNGSAGGSLNAELDTTIPDLRTTLDQIARGETDSLIRNPIRGSITATNLAIRQDSAKKEFGTYHATINSKLAISGPAIEPLIKGNVNVTDTNILLPSVFSGAGPSAELLFNPHFEIPLALDGIARFRTSTADVSLAGNGMLAGTLSQPDFSGTLTVVSGRLNLPTSRVTLEEGGTMRPSYSVSSTGETTARVDVNLEGRTAVTSLKFGDTVQRYDIHLFITGDLLSDAGLNLNATSDPPDLSKDEILGLLGQTEVLKSIGSGSGVTQSEAEKRIRNALVSIAVPQLTQGLTAQLAANLGLEYLSIDYNAIEGASLDFAKVLGKGLVLQGRRQISPTAGNRKLDYDLRLTYRLPSRNVALSRVVFSVGLDQDRPWKLGVEYGFRF